MFVPSILTKKIRAKIAESLSLLWLSFSTMSIISSLPTTPSDYREGGKEGSVAVLGDVGSMQVEHFSYMV